MSAFLINKKGMVGVKSVLIPVTVAGLALGTFLNQVYKEKVVEARLSAPVQAMSRVQGTKQESKSVPSYMTSQNSLSRLKDYIKSVEEKNGFLQQKSDLLETLLGSKEKELAMLNTQYNDLKAEYNAKMNDLYAQLANKDIEISNLNDLKLNLENQIKELTDRVAVLFNSQAGYQNQLSALQQEKIALALEFDKIQVDFKAQMTVNETLNTAIAGLKESLSKKEQENLDLARGWIEVEAVRKNTDSELKALKVAKIDNEMRISELSARLRELQVLYDEAREFVMQSSNLSSQKTADMQEKLDEINTLEARLDKVSREKEELLVSLNEKEKSLFELNNKLSERQAEVAALTKEVVSTKMRYARVEEDFNSSIQGRQEDLAVLQGDLHNKEAQVSGLQREADEAKALVKQMEQKLDEQASLNNSLKSSLRGLTAECELLRAEKQFYFEEMNEVFYDFKH